MFLNPPFAADLVGRFVGKLCDHVEAGDVPAAVLLVNNATETGWFQRALGVAAAVCFPAGRLRFRLPGGKSGPPLQGQAVLYFGRNGVAFVEAFGGFGPVMRRVSGGGVLGVG